MTAELQRIQERIEKQKERLKQLEERKKRAESKKKAREREQKRKDDTRRKILIGACMLKITEESQENHNKLMLQLDRFLTNDRDRELFGLSLKSED